MSSRRFDFKVGGIQSVYMPEYNVDLVVSISWVCYGYIDNSMYSYHGGWVDVPYDNTVPIPATELTEEIYNQWLLRYISQSEMNNAINSIEDLYAQEISENSTI